MLRSPFLLALFTLHCVGVGFCAAFACQAARAGLGPMVLPWLVFMLCWAASP